MLSRSISARRALAALAFSTGALVLGGACDPGESEPDPGDPGADELVVCRFEAPPDAQRLRGVLRLSAVCRHPKGIESVDFKVDARRFAQLPGGAPDDRYVMEDDSADLDDGMHTSSVAARSVEGTQGSARVAVFVDNTAPTVELTSPEDGQRYAGALPLRLLASDPAAPSTGDGPRAVQMLRVRLGDLLLGEWAAPDPTVALSETVDISSLPTGDYPFVVEAEDAAGNATRLERALHVVTSPRFRGVHLQPLGVPGSVQDLALGDLDDDGTPDLLLCGTGGLYARRGRGDGGFAEAQPLLGPDDGACTGLLLADIDGAPPAEVLLYGQDITGHFLKISWRVPAARAGELERIALPSRATTLALCELDGDGVPDLVLGGEVDEHGVMVLRGRGDGSFAAPASVGGVGRVRSVACQDLDGDGRTDLVLGRDTKAFSVLPGAAGGTFGIARSTGEADGIDSVAEAVGLGDFDEDGRPDVAVSQASGGFALYRGGEVGDWQYTLADRLHRGASALGSRELQVVEFDGDGHLDLLVLNPSARNLGVFRGRGDGSFEELELAHLGPNPAKLRLADLDGDGRQDFCALGDSGAQLLCVLGRGGGAFDAAPELRLPELVTALALLALRPAGALDLVALGQGKSVEGRRVADLHLWRSDGSFPRAAQTSLEIDLRGQGNPLGLSAGDLDGDGQVDLLVPSSTACGGGACPGNLNWLRGDGQGSFTQQAPLALGRSPLLVRVCDLDGDGRDDVAMAQPKAEGIGAELIFGRVAALEPLSLEPSDPAPLSDVPEDLRCAEVDGQPGPDLLAVSRLSGSLDYLRGQGKAPWVQGERQVLALGDNPRRLALGDLDGDGAQDALVSVAGDLVIAFGAAGGAAFEASSFLAHRRQEPWGVAVRDFSRDGLPDLAVANQAEHSLSFYLNAGGRSFLGPVDLHTGLGPSEIAAGDLNGDGCADLAVLNAASGSVTLLLAEGGLCAAR